MLSRISESIPVFLLIINWYAKVLVLYHANMVWEVVLVKSAYQFFLLLWFLLFLVC